MMILSSDISMMNFIALV